MKTLIISIALLLCAPVFGICQDDDSIQYIHGLPETVEDTAQAVDQEDFLPADSLVEISPEQLPRELFRTLNEEPQFEGWENGNIQRDKNTKLFWLHLRSDSVSRSYGFAPNGKVVSVEEKSLKE